MATSLEELRKKKQMLLKKAGMKNANLETIKAKHAEERRLKAEIFALEHPESSRAKSVLSSALRGFGGAVKRRAAIVAENAVRMENQRKMRIREDKMKERELELARLKASRRRKSPVKKKKAVKKRVVKRKRKY